ncbi:MAG: transaldolase [Porticoccaceae bacterium]|nr:transaldolase [Porticoccaceae bacterium]
MNKLDQLREYTDVVADTGDIEAIAQFKPVDATTNPSLLLKAASLDQYQVLIDNSANWAKSLELPEEEKLSVLADHYAVQIGCEILKLVPGRVSTEVDARLSFDTEATVNRARRLVALYEDAGIGKERLLIKIASTWEGIRAAEILEKEGTNCNLTLLFSSVQAVAAAEAGAFLISPFVGRILDWHKKAEGVEGYPAEKDPGVLSVRNIYNLYKDRGFNTVVMGASFRNAGQIEALAGCDRLTIGPNFLEELSAEEAELPRVLSPESVGEYQDYRVKDEADFRLQLNEDAMATEKLAEGIRAFMADQLKLEKLLIERMS